MSCFVFNKFYRTYTAGKTLSPLFPYSSCYRTLTTSRTIVRHFCFNRISSPPPLISIPSRKRNFWSLSKNSATATTITSAADSTTPNPPIATPPDTAPTPTTDVPPSEDILTTLDATLSSTAPQFLEFGTLKSLGLASYFTPVGWIQSLLEAVNVSTGLPWYMTIILTTTIVRLIGIPFTLRSTRAAANMVPIRSKYEGLMNDLKLAAQSGNVMKRDLTTLQIRKMQKEHGISPWNLMQGPAVQVVSSISGFIAIKRLCDLPLEQLKAEGMGWIPSLTAADPMYLLPVLSVAAMNIQMRLGRIDVLASGSKTALHFGNVMPILSVASLGILSFLPSGVLLHLLTNITLISIQSAILRIPAIRTKLKLTPLRKPNPGEIPTFRDTIAAAKAWVAENRTRALEEAERKMKEKQVMFPVKPDSSSSTGLGGKRNVRRRS